MKGGCHCGAIRFKTNKDPYWIGACYCIDCRKISGSPNTIFAGYGEKDFELLQGNPKSYQSSKQVVRTFCEVCSSPYSYKYTDPGLENNDSEKIFIPIGVFDDPSSFQVGQHIWTSQKIPQIYIHGDAPQREE